MKKRFISVFLIITVFFCFQILESKKKSLVDHLHPKYKKWLNEVIYVITKTEKEIFLQLSTDRERDILMKAFWDHRDPVKETPENEYKIEHYNRLNHVEKIYGRGFSKDGWKTDRGKIYIILGPPQHIQRFDTYSTVYPMEVWHYQVDPASGLPPFFNIVFFDRNNMGKYVLYSPIGDGPQKLLIGYQGDPRSYYDAYQELYDYNSFLAKTSVSLIPGEEAAIGTPSMSSDFLLRDIGNMPKKRIKDIYAKKFFKYKGVVDVDYSVNYINSKKSFHLIKDDERNTLFNYIVEFSRLSVDQYDDLFYANIKLNGNLSDNSGKSIFQFEKTFNIKLTPAEFQKLRNSSFAISDVFPIIPGDYKLSVLIKNNNSKEFTDFETRVSVPQPSNKLNLSSPLLAYDIKKKDTPDFSMTPFRTRQGHFMVDPKNAFKRTDRMTIFFQLYGVSPDLKKSGNIKLKFQGESGFSKEIYKNLSAFPENETNFVIQLTLKDFPSDYYQLEILLEDKNKTPLAKQSKRFTITPLPTISRAQTVSKTSSIGKTALVSFILGSQYMQIKKYQKALPFLERAFHTNPRIMQFALGLSRDYFQLKKYDKIEVILAPFLNPEKPDYHLYLFLGNVNQKLGKYPVAVTYFRKILVYHGLSVDVLNRMASCYYFMGEKEEARRAWKQSLKIDPNQEKVKKVLRSL